MYRKRYFTGEGLEKLDRLTYYLKKQGHSYTAHGERSSSGEFTVTLFWFEPN